VNIVFKFSEKLCDFLDKYALKVGRHVPLTAANTVWCGLDNNIGSILDLGCGKGINMSVINSSKRLFAVGIDIFLPYLRECKRRGIYDEVLQCDVRNVPFKSKSFDIVFCGQLIEHLDKEDAWSLIREAEGIARRRVIITTPVGMYKPVIFEENLYQEHKSAWVPYELTALGYKVRGSGVQITSMIVERFGPRVPQIFRKLFTRFVFISSALFNPVAYFYPKLAGNMVCIKDLDEIYNGIESHCR